MAELAQHSGEATEGYEREDYKHKFYYAEDCEKSARAELNCD